MSEYSNELEVFIAKQKRLLELDKVRVESTQIIISKQQVRPRQQVKPRKDNVPDKVQERRTVSANKVSKEIANSQRSKKNIPKACDSRLEVTSARMHTAAPPPVQSAIDSANSDASKNVDKPSAFSTEEPATTLSSQHATQKPPQQDEMEQWVSDTFFSYFPSFNKKQKEQKTVLSRARQQEYQEYLKNIPEVTTKHQQYMQKFGSNKPSGTVTASNEKGTGTTSPPPPGAGGQQPQVRFGKSLVAEANVNFRKGSPREKLIQDLAHTDLPTILNTDTIDRRNRMLADEESRRKMEYQRELIKQIEEKRKEVERLREKEKLEEEMLTSRLEQQLKTMQLEEQLEHERVRSEKIRIANEQNHIRRLQLLANLENDHKLFNPYDGQRKAFSENGVKAPPAAVSQTAAVPTGPYSSGDERTKVYRYFSNSAQNEKHGHLASSSALSSEQDYESSSETTMNSMTADHHHRYQYCKSCRADIDRSFLPPPPAVVPRGSDYAKHQRQHCAKCGCKRSLGKDDRRCVKCDRSIKRTGGSKAGSLCAVCALASDADKNAIQQKLQQQRRTMYDAQFQSTQQEEENVRRQRKTAVSPTNNPYKVIDIQYHESDNDNGDLAVLNPVIVRNNYRKPPYSLNIEKDSLFHPSKKTPEPVLSVNIRNGEVSVDNRLRTQATTGVPSRPASPSDADEGRRDDESSSATVGDDLLDERIAKYVRHYNTLWMKRGNSRKNNTHNSHQQQYNYHEDHHVTKGSKFGSLLPSLSPPKVYVSDRPENLKSDALKLVEKKWEVPAVERTKVNEKGSARVLTQLGAIRKQLQLEQLQMDNGPSTYTKNY